MTENLNDRTELELAAEWKAYCMHLCREGRDKRLAATDYIHMPDVNVSDAFRASVMTYRQELREFPATFSSLYEDMTEEQQDGVTPQSLPFPEKPTQP